MAQEPILLLFSESVPWGQVLGWVLDIQGIYFSIYLKGREMGRGDRERGGEREKKKREKRKDGELCLLILLCPLTVTWQKPTAAGPAPGRTLDSRTPFKYTTWMAVLEPPPAAASRGVYKQEDGTGFGGLDSSPGTPIPRCFFKGCQSIVVSRPLPFGSRATG